MSEAHRPDAEMQDFRRAHVPIDGIVERSPEQIDPVVLGRRMLRTLRFTFAVAQGDQGPLHATITSLSALKYRSEYGGEAVSAAVATVDRTQIEQLRLPGQGKHGKNLTVGGIEPKTPAERQNLISAQFRYRWNMGPNTFGYELNDPNGKYEPGSEKTDAKLVSLIDGMTGRDAHYLDPEGGGRDVGESGRDPRGSFVREYVLLGKTIGDSVIDAVLADAREIVVNRTPHEGWVRLDAATYMKTSALVDELYSSKLPALAAQWGQFKPGEPFMDQEAIAGTRLATALAAPPSAR